MYREKKKLSKHYNNWRFMVTSACNSRCIFCHRDGTDEGNDFLNIDFFKSLVKKYKKHITKVRFSGGEPLLHPEIFEMISIVNKLTNNVGITTNGTFIQKHYDSIVKSQLPRINISLHTINSTTYNRITRLSIQQHENILTIIPQLKEHLALRINVVIMRGLNSSKEELTNLLRYAISNQISLEFIEFDLGAVNDIDYEKFHHSPQQLINDIQDICKAKFLFDKTEGRWEATIEKSQIGVHLGLCTNKLCNVCIETRPILVYPNGKVTRCRLNHPLVRGIDADL